MNARLVEIAKTLLHKYPNLYLKAKAFRNGRKLMDGVGLSTYAVKKSCMESFTDMGVGNGLVEVETLFTTLNSGTERANFLGLPNTQYKFPSNPGGSGLGRVAKVGKGVRVIKKGDIVAGPFKHASRVAIPETQLARIKPGVSHESASFMHLAIIAIQGIRMGRVDSQKKVAVIGQGIIGRLATLIARGIGAEVVVITRSNAKLKHFKESNGIALAKPGGKEKLADLNADVVIDASGNPDVIHDCKAAVTDGGTIVLLGSNRGITPELRLDRNEHEKRFTMVGAHIRNISSMPSQWGNSYSKEADFLQDLMLERKLDMTDILTRQISCAELSQYYNTEFIEGKDSGVLVDWRDQSGIDKLLSCTPSYDGPPTYNFSSRLNIALVGCGASGVVHANAIKEGTSFKLHTVMDVNLQVAVKLGESFGAKHTDNYDNILNNKEIDAVIIASPHFLHREMALEAIKAKKHVLVDKPLAIDKNEGREIIQAAIDYNVLVKTFHQRIFEPPQQFARELIEQDAIGEIIGVSMAYHRDKPMSYWLNSGDGQLSWRARKELSGGGFLMMNLVHELDYFRYVTGTNFSTVSANLSTLHHPIKVEDSIGVVFTLENGAVGTISAGSVTKGNGAQIMRIWGEAGHLVIYPNQIEFFSHRKLGEYDRMRWHKVEFEPGLNTRRIQFDDFRRSIEAGEKSTFRERGYEVLKIVSAFYESSEKNEIVKIPSLS